MPSSSSTLDYPPTPVLDLKVPKEIPDAPIVQEEPAKTLTLVSSEQMNEFILSPLNNNNNIDEPIDVDSDEVDPPPVCANCNGKQQDDDGEWCTECAGSEEEEELEAIDPYSEDIVDEDLNRPKDFTIAEAAGEICGALDNMDQTLLMIGNRITDLNKTAKDLNKILSTWVKRKLEVAQDTDKKIRIPKMVKELSDKNLVDATADEKQRKLEELLKAPNAPPSKRLKKGHKSK